MTPTMKRGFGMVSCFAIVFLLATGVRGAESQQPAPATASQAQAPTSPPSRQQPAQQWEVAPCQGMMMGGMGMQRMGKGPGPMPGMGMMVPGGTWMPGMMMGGMGMMPVMRQHMMMHMMAHNPKLAGKLMQMRADMMRAVADVLTKYGKEMESGQWPAAKDKGSEGD